MLPVVWRAATRPEWVFVLLAMVFGLSFAALTPPGYNPDEPHQFFRAIQSVNGVVLAPSIAHDDFSDLVDRPAEHYGGAIDEGYARIFDVAKTYPIVGPGYPGAARSSLIDWNELWGIHLTGQTIDIGFSNTAVYSPLAYAPSIVAIAAGQIVHAPAAAIFYGARVLSLLAATLITFLAIRLVPVGKWALMAISLLPTTIIEFAAVSADPMTISAAFLLTAYSLRLAMMRRSVLPREWVALGGMLLVMGLVKPSYAVLFGVVIAIPVLNKGARTARQLLSLFGTLLITGIPAIVWQRATSYLPPSFSTTQKVDAQIEYAVSHPLTFAKTLFYTFFTDQGPGRFFYPSFFGSAIWNGVFLPTFFIYVSVGALIISTFIVDRREIVHQKLLTSGSSWIVRGGFVTIFALSCGLLALGLYAIWAEPQLSVVTGMQGRYFLPLAFLVSFCFVGLRLNHQKIVRWLVVIASIFSLAIMLWSVYRFVYVGPISAYWP